jgi:hypothetical protein
VKNKFHSKVKKRKLSFSFAKGFQKILFLHFLLLKEADWIDTKT